jgi:hypothetical protein
MTLCCIEPNRVETQEAFDSVLTEVHPMALALNQVHLNPTEHIILAQTFLKVVEYNW